VPARAARGNSNPAMGAERQAGSSLAQTRCRITTTTTGTPARQPGRRNQPGRSPAGGIRNH